MNSGCRHRENDLVREIPLSVNIFVKREIRKFYSVVVQGRQNFPKSVMHLQRSWFVVVVKERAQLRRQRQKSNRSFLAKNNVARELAFLYIYLPSLHDHDVNFPNFTFYSGPKHKATIVFFLFLTWMQIEPNGIKAMKFETVGIDLLDEVFAAVAIA